MRPHVPYSAYRDKHTDTSDSTACWSWGGRLDSDGYGRLTLYGAGQLAHRMAYEDAVGPIPAGLDVDHVCRNRACVNPAHLEAITRRENLLRRPRLTHCKAGHEYTEANTRVRPSGRRDCRACDARRAAEYNMRRSA